MFCNIAKSRIGISNIQKSVWDIAILVVLGPQLAQLVFPAEAAFSKRGSTGQFEADVSYRF